MIVSDPVEIVLADIHRQVAAPVIGIAPIDDGVARLDVVDHIRSAAKGRIEGRGLEINRCVAVPGQDRHQAEDQGQLSILARGEDEPDPTGPRPLDPHDLGIIGAEIGPTVVAQGLEREHDVVHRHRTAVGEPGPLVEGEFHPAPVVGRLDRAGQQSVERERLVEPPGQQALEHMVADARRRHALDDHRIGAVEGAEHRERKLPPFGAAGFT